MRRISPLIKGLITSAAMVITTLLFSFTNTSTAIGIEYILVYVLYAGGIAWTLIDYSRSDAYVRKFGSIFGQGFRCFIIVTLVIVAFIVINTLLHPELIEEAAKNYREDLIKQQQDRTLEEIDAMVAKAKDNFLSLTVSQTIFGTLITGAIFTAAGAGLLLFRRK